MPSPVLRVTDGASHVYLHGLSGFALEDWTPLRPGLKEGGVWSDSPLADGRRLRLYKRENAIETFELVANHRHFEHLRVPNAHASVVARSLHLRGRAP